MDYQLEIASLISEATKIALEQISFLVKEPKKGIEADWAINCFALSPYIDEDGNKIAEELLIKLQKSVPNHAFIHEITRVGSYINFKLNEKNLIKSLYSQISENFENFLRSAFVTHTRKIVVIEYPSQNTNKPLHLGHVRNMVLGQTLSSIYEFAGDDVHQVNLMNDKGIHICKSMLAYKRWGRGTTPERLGMKSDHFVGKYYVTYSKHEYKLEQELKTELQLLKTEKSKPKKEQNREKIQQLESIIHNSRYGKLNQSLTNMLIQWENGDPEIRRLWNKMNAWAKKGFEETYKIFDIQHEKVYLESDIYDKGRDIVLDGLEKEHFVQLEDGAVVARFNKKGLPREKVLLRRDGTTLYITQDLFLAMQKMKDFNYDMSIYVIGNEQDMQLRTLFELLSLLGFKGNNIHYSYGMINLKSGKMKSREGIVVDADNVVEDIEELSYQEVKNRYKYLPEKDMQHRAHIIALAALRFFILKYEYARDFIFDLEESISFEGETGVYLLYVYARICSIFLKGLEQDISTPYEPKTDKFNHWTFSEIPKDIAVSERNLIIQLTKYPNVLYTTYNTLKSHLLCRYLLELAQLFNNFYHECPILKESDVLREFRLTLCEIVRKIMKHGLNLMHIDTLTEM